MRKIWILCLALLLCLGSSMALAKDKNELQPAAIITMEEMHQRLQNEPEENDLLYVKIGEDRVEAYQGLASNRSLRKQLILSLPHTEMLRFYTVSKVAFEQMSKMLLDYEQNNADFNGYKIIADKDLPQKLKNGKNIYRFWCMKIKREKASRSKSFPIGIGIGIGGGHHHGPWIGIGL